MVLKSKNSLRRFNLYRHHLLPQGLFTLATGTSRGTYVGQYSFTWPCDHQACNTLAAVWTMLGRMFHNGTQLLGPYMSKIWCLRFLYQISAHRKANKHSKICVRCPRSLDRHWSNTYFRRKKVYACWRFESWLGLFRIDLACPFCVAGVARSIFTRF